MNTVEQITSRISVDANGCWTWTGGLACGYGRFNWQGKDASVHRTVYELVCGPIPDGLHLDHLCRNRACCNPRHLEPVTNQVNVWRGIALINLGHCKSGRHQITSEDNDTVTDSGYRRCRQCRAESKARWAARKHAA